MPLYTHEFAETDLAVKPEGSDYLLQAILGLCWRCVPPLCCGAVSLLVRKELKLLTLVLL